MPGTLVINPDKTFIGILEQRHAHLPLLSEPMPLIFRRQCKSPFFLYSGCDSSGVSSSMFG